METRTENGQFGTSECCNESLVPCECPAERTDYRYCSKCYKHVGELVEKIIIN